MGKYLLAMVLTVMVQAGSAQQNQETAAVHPEVAMLAGTPATDGDALPTLPPMLEAKAAMVEPVVPVVEKKVELPHRFFDKTNISLAAMTMGAALADGITTQHALGQKRVWTKMVGGVPQSFTTTYEERNPVAAPLVNRGWPGQVAATLITTGASMGLSNLLHRSGHHKMERVIPFLFAGTSASFAAHNATYW